MLTLTTDYAIRAALRLAASPSSPIPAATIARDTRIPGQYASRVLLTLVEAGVAESRRGPNGGYSLTKRPETISLLDLVEATEPTQSGAETSHPPGPIDAPLAAYRRANANIERHRRAALAAITLASLLEAGP